MAIQAIRRDAQIEREARAQSRPNKNKTSRAINYKERIIAELPVKRAVGRNGGASWCGTALKMMRIAMIAFLTSFSAMAVAENHRSICTRELVHPFVCSSLESNQSPQFWPYVSSGNVLPTKQIPIYRFLEDQSRLMIPGVFLSNRGKEGCLLSNQNINLKECDFLSTIWGPAIHGEGKIKMPELERKFNQVKEKVHDYTFGGQQIEVPFQGKTYSLTVGNDPQRMGNYREALKFLNKEIADRLFDKEPEEVVRILQQINRLMRKGLPNSEDAGEMRKTEVVLKAAEDVKFLDNDGEPYPARPFFCPDSVCQPFPQAARVPAKMLRFARKLKEFGKKLLQNRRMDAIGIAAWAHQQIVIIHPFSDGNGRTARCLMQILLRCGGYGVVGIPNKREYGIAIRKDEQNPGYFVRYLESLIRWSVVLNM